MRITSRSRALAAEFPLSGASDGKEEHGNEGTRRASVERISAQEYLETFSFAGAPHNLDT